MTSPFQVQRPSGKRILMISSLFLGLLSLTSDPKEISSSLNRWIRQAADLQASAPEQSLAYQQVIAAVEMRTTVETIAEFFAIQASPKGLSEAQIQDLVSKVLARIPIENIRRTLNQLQNPDRVVQVVALKDLKTAVLSPAVSEQPHELALKLLYTKDYSRALNRAYQQGLNARSEILSAKKEKDLSPQVLQQLLEEVTSLTARAR
jgi:hypothetical protein